MTAPKIWWSPEYGLLAANAPGFDILDMIDQLFELPEDAVELVPATVLSHLGGQNRVLREAKFRVHGEVARLRAALTGTEAVLVLLAKPPHTGDAFKIALAEEHLQSVRDVLASAPPPAEPAPVQPDVEAIDRAAKAAREALSTAGEDGVTPWSWLSWAECNESHREAWRAVARAVAVELGLPAGETQGGERRG